VATTDELERRIDRLEIEDGRFLRLASGIQASQTLILEWLERIEAKLDERPSGVMYDGLRRGLESVRAKQRPSRELELVGPAWLGKAKLSGFSGLTLVAVLAAALAGLVAWLLLRR